MQPELFSRFSSSDDMMRAVEEMPKAKAEKVDAEVVLAKTGGKEAEDKD